MSIAPAPHAVENEVEVFGTYGEIDKASNKPMKYDFHLWMNKENANIIYGKIDLPFTCITENKLFCIFKNEHKTEEGGLLYVLLGIIIRFH